LVERYGHGGRCCARYARRGPAGAPCRVARRHHPARHDHAARQRHGHRTRIAPGRHRRAPGVPYLVARVCTGVLRGPRLRLSAQARDLRTPGAVTRRTFEHAPGGNRRARDQNVLWLPRPAPVRHRICRGAQQARGLPPARRTRYRGTRVVPQRRGPFGAKCHRSYQVNLRNIDHFDRTDIVMRSGACIPLSRSSKQGFQDAYFAVRFEGGRR